mgnify:CR=1 FL=1
MKFQIKHEIKGRMRLHIFQKKQMSCEQADILLYYLENIEGVESAKVYERTADAVVRKDGFVRQNIIKEVQKFVYDKVEVPDGLIENSGRELNREFQEKLIGQITAHYARKFLLPAPFRAVYTGIKSLGYIWKGLQTLAQRKLEVPVLDATAIGVSILRGNYDTAGSVMFLLGIGELLEDWTHKKSVGDLARIMSLNVEKVWLKTEDGEVLVPYSQIKQGDSIVVHMGNVIPFDGTVLAGEAMVNQASLTGESMPVRKSEETSVYAGTVVEEGEITVKVKAVGGSGRYDKIVTMIEDSQKLKSGLEGKAEHLADKLVPYTLAGTGLVYLATRNATKAIAVLMVDFSCALKLAMPISVLSAIREASQHNVTVKGGKYMEAVAEADTIVFDKTGTLTKAEPTVAEVVPFGGNDADEMLRMAACMEEHFPHSMAKAVVNAAQDKGLIHEEFHSKVEYIVAHGISSKINDQKVVVGSYHFVFEDEESQIPEGMEEKFQELPSEYSHLYMAIEGKLAAVICIEDPLREEAPQIIKNLKAAGISKVVMMTGDSDRTAKAIAKRVGVDVYYSEVLPEDKANFVEQEKAAGRKVIMIGDGINDSPALSAADIGIAISDGAEIAREIADVTMSGDDLSEIVTLKMISNKLMKRIHKNYRNIVGFNTALIILGVTGILQPTVSALLHNTSTLYISLKSMENLLEEENEVEEYI